MKKDLRVWAIKLRGRSFAPISTFSSSDCGEVGVCLFGTLQEAIVASDAINEVGILAKPVRVKVRIEEIA